MHTNTFCKYRKNYSHRLACILFSCGMSLAHPDILDSTKWKSNMLGKLQMEIRDKLNKS